MQEYKIAVVANMSAGKSTFINAMFADDILPAYKEATTDCPIYIYSDDNPKNDKAVIEFLDNKESVVLDKDDVKKHIKLYSKKDTFDLKEQYKNVKKIDLYWDFKILQNKDKNQLKFVVIDTPGPNNTDNFQNKHRNITQDIIQNEASMLIYLFDYGQIDSNLEVSNGNIWDMVIKRKEEDEDFEVFFVINKIDMAFEDNRKLSKVRNSKTKEEFYQNIKEFWYYHENKAIEKIEKIAQKYGFLKPKVFTSSAYYQKLIQMEEISWDDEDKLDSLKKLFKSVFKEDWEKELLNYLKVNSIEKHTLSHILNIEKNDSYRGLNELDENYMDQDSLNRELKKMISVFKTRLKENYSDNSLLSKESE